MKFRKFYTTTAASFFDHLDQNRVLSLPVVGSEVILPPVQHLRDFCRKDSASFFIEFNIQEGLLTTELLAHVSPILLHPDYFKLYGQCLIGIKGNNAGQDSLQKFFRDMGFPPPLVVLYQNPAPFFVPIHYQNAALVVGDGIHSYESLVAESFIYATDSKMGAPVELENILVNVFSEKHYFNFLMERNSRLCELDYKALAQAEKIKNLQLYNELLRTESKKEIEWFRNQLKNYQTWGPIRLYLSKLYRKAKGFLRKHASL